MTFKKNSHENVSKLKLKIEQILSTIKYSDKNFRIEIEDGSILKKYLDTARSLTPEERGKLLENDASFTEAHQELAVEGQTDANPNEPVLHHFIVFINHNNELYELDGRKTYPIKHCDTTDDTFLQVITYYHIHKAIFNFNLF